jgi:hypothetical protein
VRVEYFGFFLLRAITDVFAIVDGIKNEELRIKATR